MIGNVHEFHQCFGLPLGDEDKLDAIAAVFRLGFIEEEFNELQKALDEGDKVGAFDALLDLVYVAQGTALFMGINPAQWDAGMRAVHNANMEKVRATCPSESKRDTDLDVIKPNGWVGPEKRLEEILNWYTQTNQQEMEL